MDINSLQLIIIVLTLHCATTVAGWGCRKLSETECSVTCGGGTKTRKEKCCVSWIFNRCIGRYNIREEEVPCNTDPCCHWTNWRSCSTSCGVGTRNRLYLCCPSHIDCHGGWDEAEETESCGSFLCRNGNWGSWSSWSPCSVTCGQGTIEQTRSCNNPYPHGGGSYCSGSGTNTTQCVINPVQGNWTDWTPFSPCTKTCGGGTHTQTRRCNKPNCGIDCPGSSIYTTSCNTNCCPVNGNWGSWNREVSDCSVTCGWGTRRRGRSCNSPSPKCGGSYCAGNNYKTETCYIPALHGGWGTWSKYSSCSQTCGGGQQTRTRACNNPTPENCGKTCSGNMSQILECNSEECPPECYAELCNGNGCHDGEKCNCKEEYTGADCNIDCRIREFPGPCREKRDECVALADKLICPCETQSEKNLTCIYNICDQMHCSRHGICFEKKAMSISNPLIYCICNKGYTRYDCSNYIPTAAPNSTAPPRPASVQTPVQESYITNVWPTYGPKAGGTVITLDGQNLPLGSIVQIGNELICETVHVNGTRLLGITPKLTPSVLDIIDKGMPITVNMDSDEELKSTFKFVFKENPSIWKVYPTSTIIQGGTELTVLGSNLDSVAVITMETSMVLKEIVQTKPTVYAVTATEYITSCTILNSTQMFCLTPNIDLPPGFDISADRSKRELNSRDINPISNTRVKRDLKIELSNDGDILEFYIGFTMDGVDGYQNYTVIDVFVQPEFHLDQQTWKYDENTRLTFKGEHLDVGVTVHDYKVMIETVQCGQLELLSNELSCLPPDASPELMEDNDDANPRIMIQVGLNIQHVAGYITYTDNQLPVYVVALASVIPACAVIVIVVVVGVVCVRKRPGEK